jgi:DNA-binding Lrp family transcriptional regulator
MKKYEKSILLALDKPLPIEKNPFLSIAKRTGIPEKVLLEQLKKIKKNGLVRKFGAILGHRNIGFKENVLVAWKVQDELLDDIAEKIIHFKMVSHCYARKSYPLWPYNLYTMIHGKNKKECLSIVKKISQKTNLKQKKLLFTKQEFKKTKTNLEKILK